ncbi:conserved hypothetical protein [Tenacibaculum sp. 190524A05c]|uniref:hypothetical protein n=1 Tax=Tenacibaculum platacis TaxID=3137852 RepID=UPI0031FA5ABD
MNNLIEKIRKDTQYMENSHVNDPKIDILLDEIEFLLLKDSETTIEIIKGLDLLSIEWICSRFEKISYELQSKELVECLEGLLEKFSPDINSFKDEVQEAKDALIDS